MRILPLWTSAFVATLLVAAAAHAAPPSTRAQARQELEQPDVGARLTAIARLAEIGRMADADRVLAHLGDDEAEVRALAAAATWQIWSRSGDPAIDRLFARGVEQMEASAWADALMTFTAIVKRKPDFAEGWNKRATLYFLIGRNTESLKDCDQVLKRNPKHFGALAGAGQLQLQLGHPELALALFRRALAVNPNMEGPARMIPVLEEMLREAGSNRI